MKINKFAPILCEYASKPFNALANTKPMKAICDKFEVTPEKAIALTTIASIVGKDSIGCYMYVKQSLNNEKIPEEKRSFVAALDLTNGGLMILSQLAMFFTINNKKVQSKLFGKFFDKVFSDVNRKAYVTAMRTKDEFKSLSKVAIEKQFDSIKKRSEDTFSFLTSLIASTTIAKRVIVPFIATPLAGWAKEKYFDKNTADTETEKQETPKKAEECKEETVKSASKEQEFKGNLLKKYTTK